MPGDGGVLSRSSSPRSNTSPISPADDEDEYMGSSTSTAGPPPESNTMTVRFTRPQWSLATGRHYASSGHSAASSCSTHTLKVNQTESYRPGLENSGTDSANLRDSPSRTMSNTSVSVSPMDSSSPQEWGRSFRLFNSCRFLSSASGSRQRDGSIGQLYRSTLLHGRQCRGSSIGPDAEKPLFGSTINHQPQGSLFGTFGGQGGRYSFWHPDGNASGLLTAASPYAASNPSAPFSTVSPLLGTSRFLGTGISPRGLADGHAVHRVVASCAMGSVVCSVSPGQNELPLAMNALRTHIAVHGKTIIQGNAAHPLDIRKGPLIGAGGFAKVFAGVDTVRGELVAIKEIDISGVDDVKALKAIEEEFALLKSLHHPNIVSYSLFEHSKSQKVCRIAMELLAGDSTLHLLQKFGPLTEAVLRIVARSVLRAIRFIHKEGIFHRDIKPANILVSHRGEVKLCDFGCSKRVSELNKAASCIIGTPVYMAPEFIKGEANHKADIWSMACSLFELSTGLLPWYHSGVKDNLPLMFYLTTTSESPMVLPSSEAKSEFSAEFLNFMELCFTRNVANRPEADDLLKHPWITGSRLAPVSHLPSAFLSLHPEGSAVFRAFGSPGKSSTFSSPRDSAADRDDMSFNGSDGLQKSVSTTPTLNPAEEEMACQHELETVAAATALELCSLLVCSLEIPPRAAQEPATGEVGSGTGDTSPSLTRTFSIHSPALSHRGGGVSASVAEFLSPVYTPEHSMVHENFYYSQVPLGASAGNFVLPPGLDLDGAPPQQQYLRINEEGNLDMVHLPGDEMEDSVQGRPSFCDSVYGSLHTGRIVSPARNSSFSKGTLSPRAAAGPNAMTAGDGHFSPVLGISGVFSRRESPSRGCVSVLSSPQGIPAPPLLYRPVPPATFVSQTPSHTGSAHTSHVSPMSASKAGSNRDAVTPHTPRSNSPTSTQRSESFRGLPEKLKAHADGKLHMSFSVNTAPGCAVNVELNVDVTDVQCKVVDNQPNFVVAFTDDVRNQIANKIKEVSEKSSSSMPTQTPGTRASPVSPSSGTETRGSISVGGGHFYNSPLFSSAPKALPRPLSGVSTSSAQRLLAVPRDTLAVYSSYSGEEGSDVGSQTSSTVTTGSNEHVAK
ncbi:protein kinase, putative [Leishmania tarentolae]|uniref:mitogen-activated protein kinase kinase n=1 Tax=Leishmania tarentolae TaxID=5689 RepID=A0A640KNM5_LEITA|nr:protein kinase, putative [Leishmania tarentolae]